MTAFEALIGTTRRVEVERAAAEFRAGRPVLMSDTGGRWVLAIPSDGLDDARLRALAALSGGSQPTLVLTGRRAHWLGLIEAEPAVVGLPLTPAFDTRAIQDLVLASRDRAPRHLVGSVGPVDATGYGAVELARIGHLAPSAILLPIGPEKLAELAPYMVGVSVDAVLAYRTEVPADLTIVSQARVPLRNDISTRFVVFRGGISPHDQVAIVVGTPQPDQIVPVRLHSACLTGDLFGSLKCDCGDQLRNTVELFHELGSGVLLYLDQEGRGIGIANKMRAYRLQEGGFDTIDADAQLGFNDDERSYEEAARMLQLLGLPKVALHSNNPRKLEALRRAGLDVVAREPVNTPVTLENARYLKTKALRAGHLIDTDWVDEVEAALQAAARGAAAE